jgi:hypothetical protein
MGRCIETVEAPYGSDTLEGNLLGGFYGRHDSKYAAGYSTWPRAAISKTRGIRIKLD